MASLVSILTPVYNGALFISTAIESLLRQMYPDWELLVIDDGSTDETAAIVRSYDDPRIRYFHQPNRGQSAALNVGLDLAAGSYVTTLDADDWLTTDSLSKRVNYLDTHNGQDAVYSDGWYCTASGQPIMRFSQYRPSNPEGDVYDDLVISCFFGTGAPVMIRRSVLERHHLRYDESIIMGQDWDFYVRLAERASFGYVAVPTVWYRLHATNMTMSMLPQRKQDDLLRVKRKMRASPRFRTVAVEKKGQFFYNLLITDLRGRPADQAETIHSSEFGALPAMEQARLLRLMATDLLMAGQHIPQATQWLQMARQLARGDVKTELVTRTAAFSPRLAAVALRQWRRRPGPASTASVLDLALHLETTGN